MATQGRTIADAEGDIAALVYASDGRPDLVLCDFARHLADSGRRVCGLVQLRDRASGEATGRVMVLESRQVVDIVPAGGCRLDAQWLDEMGVRIKTLIARGVDAVVVNRFGPLEAAGRGFSEAIAAASETKTPLVIAVPEFEFERWTRFSSGMTVKLDCKLDKVLDWWHRVLKSDPSRLAVDARACELFK
jgi:Protein of unknown function (DUF2478)